MNRISAGIVLFELDGKNLRVLLIHPGGPYNVHKDVGHWSIPKGEVDEGEDLFSCAARELTEETGQNVGTGPFIPLGNIVQKGGKTVHAWGAPGKWNAARFSSNSFEMEWPPKSGRMMTFPEVDRAEMLPLAAALYRIKNTQRPLLERLAGALGVEIPLI